MLWAELESVYPDQATFIPGITKVVEAWCDSLIRRLEDDNFEPWTEVLLDKLKPGNAVKLSIQVSEWISNKGIG